MPQGSPKSGLKLDRSRRNRTHVVSLLMTLLFYGIGTRTYRLEASNAAPPISTTAGVYSEYCAPRFAGMIGRERDAWDARLLGGTDPCDP
jgi:hypothetical protein